MRKRRRVEFERDVAGVAVPTGRSHREAANNSVMGNAAAIGLCGSTAVALTGAGADLGVLDRRSITTRDCQPYHDAQGLSVADAEKLIAAAYDRAVANATDGLRALVESLDERVRVAGISFKEYRLAPSLEVRLRSHPMCHGAEGEMTRDALWAACEALGLEVHAVPPDAVDARAEQAGKLVGAPWRKEHKLAATAALSALGL
jgi:hypothetical protein